MVSSVWWMMASFVMPVCLFALYLVLELMDFCLVEWRGQFAGKTVQHQSLVSHEVVA